MQKRRIGEVEVSAIGLGGMPISVQGRPDRTQAIETINAAIDAGVTFIDTADAYSLDDTDFGHNEELIAEGLRGRSEEVFVATKGGHTRVPGGGWELDGRPEYLRKAVDG